jgi:hypothetical protein
VTVIRTQTQSPTIEPSSLNSWLCNCRLFFNLTAIDDMTFCLNYRMSSQRPIVVEPPATIPPTDSIDQNNNTSKTSTLTIIIDTEITIINKMQTLPEETRFLR